MREAVCGSERQAQQGEAGVVRVNETTTEKTCTKCENTFVVTQKNKGYCPRCYPFPRVYCRGCGQPLTSEKHRARGIGARCLRKENEGAKPHMKEEVPYVEIGDPKLGRVIRKYKSMEELF